MNSTRRSSVTPHLSISGSLLALLTTAVVATPFLSSRVEAQTPTSDPKIVLNEAWQIVNRSYVDSNFNSVNWQQVRRELLGREYSSQQEAYQALQDALKQLNDPYTRFLDPTAFAALQSQTAGELTGVGLQLEQDATTQAIRVAKVIENSPAARANRIQVGDIIVNIDGQTTQGLTLDQAVQKIRGVAGTPVRLSFQSPNQRSYQLNITRARIELPAVTSAVRYENNHKVGYIRLSQFNAHSGNQMQQAIRDLEAQQVEGYVLDLRGNPGGLLTQAIAISRMWLDRGAIVQTVDRNGLSSTTAANRTALTRKPLVILVDQKSASASEIVAGALQDNQRATVVGSQTFGKALVQSVNRLSDGSGINVTISRYLTPNGQDINKRGILPNVVVNLSEEQQQAFLANSEQVGTLADPQYSQALRQLVSHPAIALRPQANLPRRHRLLVQPQ